MPNGGYGVTITLEWFDTYRRTKPNAVIFKKVLIGLWGSLLAINQKEMANKIPLKVRINDAKI